MTDHQLTTAAYLCVFGIVAHLVADWLLQNEWQALNKANLRHPAGYVHAGIHGLCLLLVFPWQYALAVAVLHLLIDTRVPLAWWGKVIKQTDTGPMAVHVAIWRDQVLHIVIIAGTALIVAIRASS